MQNVSDVQNSIAFGMLTGEWLRLV